MTAKERYLGALAADLHTSPRRRARIVREVAEHLDDAFADAVGTDAERWDAVTEAFGSPVVIAEAFNAETGRRAARTGLVLIAGVGLLVLGGLVIAAQAASPRTSAAGSWLHVQQAAFFGAVLAAECAVVAAVRAASRIGSVRWSSSMSTADRALVRSCCSIALAGCSLAAIGWTAALIVDRAAGHATVRLGDVAGVVIMVVGVVAGWAGWMLLRFNVHAVAEVAARPSVWAQVDERAVQVLRRWPLAVCSLAAVGTAAWVAATAETASILDAWPWAVAQLVAVAVGFVTIGRRLGLHDDRFGAVAA